MAARAFRPKAVANVQDWARELAAEFPDEAWLAEGVDEEPPKDEPWHLFYWEAWHALRYDRQYVGQFGAEMPISWQAIDAYARRYGIEGEAFDLLLRFVSVIDVEHIAAQAEERAAVAARPKPEETSQNG